MPGDVKMKYVREANMAYKHPIYKAAKRRAEKSVTRQAERMREQARALRARAEEMLSDAKQLERATFSYDVEMLIRDEPFKSKYQEISDRGFWAAREKIGTLPRNEDGSYADPSPEWIVTKDGVEIGRIIEEDRIDAIISVAKRDGDYDLDCKYEAVKV